MFQGRVVDPTYAAFLLREIFLVAILAHRAEGGQKTTGEHETCLCVERERKETCDVRASIRMHPFCQKDHLRRNKGRSNI